MYRGRVRLLGRVALASLTIGVAGLAAAGGGGASMASSTATLSVMGHAAGCAVDLEIGQTSVTAVILSGCSGGNYWLATWSARSAVYQDSFPQTLVQSTHGSPWTVSLPESSSSSSPCFYQVDFSYRTAAPGKAATMSRVIAGHLGNCASPTAVTPTGGGTPPTTVPASTTHSGGTTPPPAPSGRAGPPVTSEPYDIPAASGGFAMVPEVAAEAPIVRLPARSSMQSTGASTPEVTPPSTPAAATGVTRSVHATEEASQLLPGPVHGSGSGWPWVWLLFAALTVAVVGLSGFKAVQAVRAASTSGETVAWSSAHDEP